jgi:hypothetical protein
MVVCYMTTLYARTIYIDSPVIHLSFCLVRSSSYQPLIYIMPAQIAGRAERLLYVNNVIPQANYPI